jgi:growth arrest-specific protein 1
LLNTSDLSEVNIFERFVKHFMMSTVIFVWFLLIEVITFKTLQQQIVENCDISLKKCTNKMTCGLALHDYRISCKQELYGRSNTSCSEICQLSVISLANTAEGYEYLNCDCADNEYCNLIRERTKSCYPEVDESAKLCRVSELYCKADSTCLEALNYFNHLCGKTLNGKECTKRCNNSLSILMRHRAGVNMKECICDGDTNYYKKCLSEKRNIFRQCYGIDYRPEPTSFSTPTIRVSAQHNAYILLVKISNFLLSLSLIISI